ncbi:META domain-containing protein [Streptomyces lunalinharesii]|uniref:DUF306 domain-containing protein n=1 Tax=Streptomyces lunalinharesii TaxID=333384 RepID=A0ABN3S9Q0_9ACTN
MRRFRRALSPTFAVLVTLLMSTACDAGRADPDVPKQRPGGAGDLLVGAVLNFDGGQVDGRKFSSPPLTEATTFLRNWVEFRRDGTVSGTYGCTPFRLTADVRADDLTLKGDSPAATVSGCPQRLTSFEQKLKEVFTGHLAISERKPDRAGEDGTLDLKNDRGDRVALSVTRPARGFFGARWHYWYVQGDDGGQGSDPDSRRISWIFHENGTMTGRLVCNGVTARAHFTGDVLTVSAMRPTTHRKCNPIQEEQDESWMARSDPFTYGVGGAGTRLVLRPHSPDPHGVVETLFKREGSS